MNIKKTAVALVLMLSLSLQSCALIFTGVRDKVTIQDGTPEGAKVYYNGSYLGNAPQKVKIPKNSLKKEAASVRIEADGYINQEIVFTRKLRVGALILDCLTGFIWLIPDFATGAIYKASPKKIKYNLKIDESSPTTKEHGLKPGDKVFFTNNDYKNQEAIVKIIYPNRAVLVFKKKQVIGSLFKKGDEIKEKEIEVEVPFVNISKNVTQ